MPDVTHTLDRPRSGRRDFVDLIAALRAVRDRLHMEVVFVSQFIQGSRVFRFVDATSGSSEIKVGDADTLEASYCQRIVDGRLPQVIPDALELPEALAIPATLAVGVRAHLSVPILLDSGEVYGTLCCFSLSPQPDLNEADAAELRRLADAVAFGIEHGGWFS
jgi:GAF domain-containing protein